MDADVISSVLKDPTAINNLIAKGYKVVAMGAIVRRFGVGLVNTHESGNTDFGARDHPIYLAIDKASDQRNANDIGFVNVDLHECRFRYGSVHALSRWSKLRVGVNYPFSVYIYIPGDGTVDGLGPEADGFEFNHMVDHLPSDPDASTESRWSVSYMNLHSRNTNVHRGWFRPWRTHGVAYTNPDALVLSAQHESLHELMEAIINV